MYQGPGIYESTYGAVYVQRSTAINSYKSYKSYQYLVLATLHNSPDGNFIYKSIMWDSLSLILPIDTLPTADSHPEFFI